MKNGDAEDWGPFPVQWMTALEVVAQKLRGEQGRMGLGGQDWGQDPSGAGSAGQPLRTPGVEGARPPGNRSPASWHLSLWWTEDCISVGVSPPRGQRTSGGTPQKDRQIHTSWLTMGVVLQGSGWGKTVFIVRGVGTLCVRVEERS